MEEKDLKQIKEAFREELASGFANIWENNLEPAFDAIDEQFQEIHVKLDKALYTEIVHLEARVKRLEAKVGIKEPAK